MVTTTRTRHNDRRGKSVKIRVVLDTLRARLSYIILSSGTVRLWECQTRRRVTIRLGRFIFHDNEWKRYPCWRNRQKQKLLRPTHLALWNGSEYGSTYLACSRKGGLKTTLWRFSSLKGSKKMPNERKKRIFPQISPQKSIFLKKCSQQKWLVFLIPNNKYFVGKSEIWAFVQWKRLFLLWRGIIQIRDQENNASEAARQAFPRVICDSKLKTEYLFK